MCAVESAPRRPASESGGYVPVMGAVASGSWGFLGRSSVRVWVLRQVDGDQGTRDRRRRVVHVGYPLFPLSLQISLQGEGRGDQLGLGVVNRREADGTARAAGAFEEILSLD